jgi:hypothetical protein
MVEINSDDSESIKSQSSSNSIQYLRNTALINDCEDLSDPKLYQKSLVYLINDSKNVVHENLEVFLQKNGFKTVQQRADGKCLIYSFIDCMRFQKIDINQQQLKDKMLNEYVTHFKERYSHFMYSSIGQLTQQALMQHKFETFEKGLGEYFNEGKWNTEIGDFILPILKNAFNLKILVFEPVNTSLFTVETFLPEARNFDKILAFRYFGNHYDSIVKNNNNISSIDFLR